MLVETESTPLDGLLLVRPKVHKDERGFFLESFRAAEYASLGLPEFVQHNHSRSVRGVLRGLHFQARQPQGKLVRAVRGTIWDVAVDIRTGSRTCGQWFGVELSDDNHCQLYVPPGYAHGFLVLSEQADVEYLCSDYYLPGDDCGIVWNDARLDIDWPMHAPLLSAKDERLPGFEEALSKFTQ